MNVRTEIPPELVEAYGATLFRCGDGSDAFVLRIGAPDGLWPAERSYLVLGIELEAAREAGRRNGQNAIV